MKRAIQILRKITYLDSLLLFYLVLSEDHFGFRSPLFRIILRWQDRTWRYRLAALCQCPAAAASGSGKAMTANEYR
jgi:hypothetical protein